MRGLADLAAGVIQTIDAFPGPEDRVAGESEPRGEPPNRSKDSVQAAGGQESDSSSSPSASVSWRLAE